MTPADFTRPQLQPQLDAITAQTRALVPAERLAGTEALVAGVRATGQEDRILAAGTPVPSFALAGTGNKLVRSSDLLALGPLVVSFFRGRWDPYDITELEAWQRMLPELRRWRALLVGISPQTQRQNSFLAEQHKITFPLLSDPGCRIADDFGLAYTVPASSQPYLRSMLLNIPLMNGDDSWRLPLPATYLISENGQILFAQASADHRLRPEPGAILSRLEQHADGCTN